MTELKRLLSQDDCCLVSVASIKKALEQEPFINKPCISIGVCHEDKVKVLDKIRTEIEQFEINGHIRDVECFRAGINTALNVIDKYKAESEGV